jgi:hypothetical protein
MYDHHFGYITKLKKKKENPMGQHLLLQMEVSSGWTIISPKASQLIFHRE